MFEFVLSLVACVALILLVVGLIFAFASDFVDSRGFDQKWPPLSDEEFLSRCPPGTTRETALRVRTIVSEQAGIPREQIYPEQRFVGDLDC